MATEEKKLKPNKHPNQRTIVVHKEVADKDHLYTVNNLEALEEAMYRLQTKLGIKLYLYLAKNQDKYIFDLYSSDFCKLCGCSMSGYRSAFAELVKEGYLVLKLGTETMYAFYEKSQMPEKPIMISNEEEVVETYNQIVETIDLYKPVNKYGPIENYNTKTGRFMF